MNKFKQILNSTGKFLKKNIYYVLIIVCIAAIATMITVTLVKNSKSATQTPVGNVGDPNTNIPVDPSKENPKEENPIITPPLTFAAPVQGSEIGMVFNDAELVFSKTLNQWSTHLGIDYLAEEGTAVCAVADGVVLEVKYDALKGYMITISHKDGAITKYCSLGENTSVIVGQSVTKGQTIGTVSTSMIVESSEGAHLHFEALLNNKLVNPEEYFVANDK